MKIAAAVALFAFLVLVPSAPAADRAAPKITSAVMQDADHDGRADGVVVTFSEKIRHASDTTKPFPLAVAGYTVKSVGAAKGKTVLVKLVEKAAADYAARPKTSYARTKSKPVSDRAGNQAKKQRFSGTLAHGRDRDGDGHASPADCAPDNGSVHPGATDLPDLSFADANCDGIDGNEAQSVFVAPSGDDLLSGTKAQPKRTIDAALATAQAAGRASVIVQSGSYPVVSARTGIGIYGAYNATWNREAGLAATTVVTGSPQALLADGDTGVTLQLMTFAGTLAGANTYGIRAVNGSALTLQSVFVLAAAGASGAPGPVGNPGATGNSGASGADGGAGGTSALGCLGGTSALAVIGVGAGGTGGDGQTPAGGGTIGLGGSPGASGSCSLTSSSNGGGAPDNATAGGPGDPGAGGAGGTPDPAALAGAEWIAPRRPERCARQAGRRRWRGRRRRRDGERNQLLLRQLCGNPRRARGRRRRGWRRRSAGVRRTGGGGGSFGIYLSNSTVTATGGSISAGNGGAGGAGGGGGAGGDGGLGGSGQAGGSRGGCGLGSARFGGAGANGKPGGRGGDGGAGGGGAGGPSIGVFRGGTSAFSSSGGTTITFGAPGQGGTSPAGGASNGVVGTSGAIVPALPVAF